MIKASAEAFKHMSAGLKAPMVSCEPLAEKRDGLGFEDHQVAITADRLTRNGDLAVLSNGGATQEDNLGGSVSVNALQGEHLRRTKGVLAGRQIAVRKHHITLSASVLGFVAYSS